MNFADYNSGNSHRRELQGPRPAPLKVRRDSHKINKPPMVPHHRTNFTRNPTRVDCVYDDRQHRPPVIIYTVSPKVIHTNPNEFLNLVQRLTGSSSSSSAAAEATTSYSAFQDNGGAMSPAARFASMEKIKPPEVRRLPVIQTSYTDMVEGVEINTGLERPGYFPGILSPGPDSLPPIQPSFISPSMDPTHFNSFFHDISPLLHSNSGNYIEGSFMPSPSNLLSSHITSPPPLDFFNNYFDF